MSFDYLQMEEANEQDAVEHLATFLVKKIGWAVVEDVADTSSDRDIVLSSPGEDGVNNSNTIYIRIRGTSDSIRLTTYESYTDTATNVGENTDTSYGLITATGIFRMWAVADLERVVIVIQEDGGNKYFGYVGRIDSYYKATEHPHPLLVKGMQNTAYDWFYSVSNRNMFMVRQDGTAGSAYFGVKPFADAAINTAGVSKRTGKSFAVKIPIRYSATSGQEEVVGELRGVYWIPEGNNVHGGMTTISGNTHLVVKSTGTYAWACGPVASGVAIPLPIPAGFDITQGTD